MASELNEVINMMEQNAIRFEHVTGYHDAIMPTRKTADSAGYDLHAYCSESIRPGEIKFIKTGIKCKLPRGKYLQLHLRSSVGTKFAGIMLANGTGIIDADYYNNPDNEGHIMIPLLNLGTKPFNIERDDRLAQLIVMDYVTTTDDNATGTRMGGFGSTGK